MAARQAGGEQVMPNNPFASVKQAVAQTQNAPHGIGIPFP
jgi:hypothetical protein